RNPDVRHTRRLERLADRLADPPARNAVIDPEPPDAWIGMSERVTVRGQGMREVSRIEVHADALISRPVDPVPEVLRQSGIPLDLAAGRLGIARMQVHAKRAGQQGERLLQIAAKFLRAARLAGVMPSDGQSSADRRTEILESADVIALPAVQ